MIADLRHLPLRHVQGIGSQKEKELRDLGIASVAALLEYFPFRYEDYRLRDLSEVQDGEKITIQARVYGEPHVQMLGYKKSRMICKLMADRWLVTAVWFNRHFLQDRLAPGTEIVVSGKWDQRRKQITVAESEFPGKGAMSTISAGALQPVYSTSGSITQKWLRARIQAALAQYGEQIEEMLPAEIVDKRFLLPRKQAVFGIHQPKDVRDGQAARKRMVYEELFFYQLKLQALRAIQRNRADGVAHPVDMEAVRQFVRSLPFTLTESQKRVIADILRDLQAPYGMNRLLQGDVGSGKTVVAATALFASIKAGYQGALMVPTEILAEQHKRSLERMFAPYGIAVGLLASSLTDRQRRDTLSSLQMGLIDVVVGTHALIQEDVYFRSLGLVVIDEQHRFGVAQRSVLRRKGMNPDVLTMTATPIPRTLAITAFGDMDVSSLRELPKGRQPVKTYWVKPDKLERVLAFVEKEIRCGRQAYVICPLIEESDKLDVQNAIDVYTQLQVHFSGGSGGRIRVGLLHGRLSAQEKDHVMREFTEGRLHLLVSTTVIEVGVDVPNASVMVVYDADRFGLSQLHQLRGRVGRGEHPSHCILIADPKNEIGKERMRTMSETTDGFAIARKDLELRGPGDFFGTRQSGLPEFRLADLSSDFDVLEMARDDAAELVARADFWTAAAYLPLRRYLQAERILDAEMLD